MSMVEWKNLGDEMKVLRGKRLTKNLLDDNAEYPVFHGGIEPLGKYSQFNRDENTVMVINVGASAGTVGYCDKKFWSSDGCFCISHSDKVNSKYLFYYLQCKTHYLQSQVRYAGIPTLDNSVVEKIKIPFISLVEQKSIVEKLDTFTSSIENLKEQIAQRRKQYEYYRDQLLDLEGKEGVEMKKIQDICVHICSGGTPSTSHKEYYEGSIPWLRTQEIDWKDIYDTGLKITDEAIANSSAKIIPANCVIVAMYGATAAKVAINRIPLSTNQACCNLEVDSNKALYKFVFYWFCKEYVSLKSLGEGSQNNINGKKIKEYLIPVPSIIRQQLIVDILDKFVASIQNLEAQLSQREKQYEYYRNKLLTFE